jgi:large subunit ribosomal protein L9
MKVILLKSIKSLGQAGEVKNVANGYAHNFLFPQKLAEMANSENIGASKQLKQKKEKEAIKGLEEVEELVGKIDGQTIEFKEKTNEEGKLYAAITTSKIVKKLKEKGFNINKKQIAMPEPIKEMGEHSVKINLDHELEAEIAVIISE